MPAPRDYRPVKRLALALAGLQLALSIGFIYRSSYIIENQRYFRDYVVHYTNAPALVSEEFRDTEDLDGLFSGWNAEEGHYDPASWAYEGRDVGPAAGRVGFPFHVLLKIHHAEVCMKHIWMRFANGFKIL